MEPVADLFSPVPVVLRAHVFAVLIGINEYSLKGSVPSRLRGAVADATAFQRYLEDGLGVPSDHIVLLTNQNATRSAIIGAIQSLGKNDKIRLGNPIVIYYAGHGTQMNAPEKWECGDPDRKIQAIVPYDCEELTESGEKIAPIPDRTINGLLFTIADTNKKGNNITVIFDCCHSASATRAGGGSNSADLVPRLAKLPPRVYSDDLDRDIWDVGPKVRGLHVSSTFTNYGMGSHMLLAASGSTEEALEQRFKMPEGKTMVRGCFSFALLKLLEKEPPENLRYSDILHRLEGFDAEKQNPQCEGHHRDRTLFNFSPSPPRLEKTYRLLYEGKKDGIDKRRIIIKAGSFHNVTKTSEFTVYYEDDVDRVAPIGVIGVKTLDVYSCVAKVPDTISCPFDRSRTLVAIQAKFTGEYNLRVWIDPSSKFLPIFNQLKAEYSESLGCVSLSTQQRQSNIEIHLADLENYELSIKLYTPPSVIPSPDMSYDWTVKNVKYDSVGGWNGLVNLLLYAAKFYGELTRAPDKVSKNIGVEFYELEDTEAISTSIEDEPTTLNPKNDGENLYKQGVVNIGISDSGPSANIPYGIKLVNNGTVDLYVNIFCFANDKLSISPCVHSRNNSPFKLDILLRGKKVKEQVGPSSLAIGYGSGGYTPLSFHLTGDPPKTEVDFLKIYLTTEPVDLSYLQQPSPFGPITRAYTPWKRPPLTTWYHITIPVIETPCD